MDSGVEVACAGRQFAISGARAQRRPGRARPGQRRQQQRRAGRDAAQGACDHENGPMSPKSNNRVARAEEIAVATTTHP
jgi:hypothetical protein